MSKGSKRRPEDKDAIDRNWAIWQENKLKQAEEAEQKESNENILSKQNEKI
jgi:hypothetical protein